LEPGKDADFLALRLPDHVEGEDASLATLAFSDLGGVAHAFVRGRRLGSPG
jgi:cytosine/adenosine deaminase-related metal-dependent hydrolase